MTRSLGYSISLIERRLSKVTPFHSHRPPKLMYSTVSRYWRVLAIAQVIPKPMRKAASRMFFGVP